MLGTLTIVRSLKGSFLGGFRYVFLIFYLYLGEIIQFELRIFQMGGENRP